jgi:outer membrane protein OmpA-like peptidoglycan-associated protein
MQRSILSAFAIASLPLLAAGQAGAGPGADYTKDQVISSFVHMASIPQKHAVAACDPNQVVTDDDGYHVHVKCDADTAGLFTLPSAGMTAAGMATKAVVTRKPFNMLLTFATGSSEMDGHDQADAHVFAEAINDGRLKGHKFRIEGYTDETGAASRNVVLSQKRADAVKTYLVQLGVDSDRLESQGFGPKLLRNDLKAARINRRVVARVLD